MSKKFLVAVDGSDHGWKALDLASELAKATDAELVVVHVVPYEPMPTELQQFAKVEGVPIGEEDVRYHLSKQIGDEITNEAVDRVRKFGLARVSARVTEGHTANQIVTVTKSEGADMVFLGSRGLGDVMGLLMGSVSHRVMQLAPCTCVAVR